VTVTASRQPVTAAHLAFRNDLLDLLRRHEASLEGIEMLALSAHLTGMLIAAQDRTRVTPEMAVEIVAANIEIGNAEAAQYFRKPQQEAAHG
jgi:hypothetical protein